MIGKTSVRWWAQQAIMPTVEVAVLPAIAAWCPPDLVNCLSFL